MVQSCVSVKFILTMKMFLMNSFWVMLELFLKIVFSIGILYFNVYINLHVCFCFLFSSCLFSTLHGTCLNDVFIFLNDKTVLAVVSRVRIGVPGWLNRLSV